jgi:hypothetical protein
VGTDGMIHTQFIENWYSRSCNIKFCLSKLKGHNIGITDGQDLLCMPLKWVELVTDLGI